MKKILLFILTVGMALGGLSATAVAAFAPSSAPTYAFDTNAGLHNWELYGSFEQAGVSLSITPAVMESGRGSLAVSQRILNTVTENPIGGVYITAESLGLANFSGCSMQLSYLYGDNPGNITNFSVFSDGIVWIKIEAPPAQSANQWSEVTVVVPDTAVNKRFGFTIPTFEAYDGVSMYIDNVIIFDKDGNAIANIGDYQAAVTGPTARVAGRGAMFMLYFMLTLFIILIAGCVAYLAWKYIKRYR
ncbi:MAG: hypothetical protein FWG90_03100 [Oscillospiraceae bacterium]|nr:hypothetical protein [Oscillospiraceae bacterium]